MTLFAVVASLMAATDGSPPAPVDVYLLGGQSNMQGLGLIKELTDGQRAPVQGAKIWLDGSFVTVTPGVTPLGKDDLHFGPELAFARVMAARADAPPVYIIKYWASGQAIDPGWHGNKWKGDPPAPKRRTFHPGDSPGDPNIGIRYGEMLERFRDGLDHLTEHGVPYTVKGFVWMQGEQDSKHEVSAGRYAKNLGRLYRRLIEDLGIPEVPFVYGQVLPKSPPAERFVCRDLVRESQWHADPDSGHPDAFRQAHMVSTDRLPVMPDEVHYTTKGQLELGARFAEEMQRALGVIPLASAP